MALASPIWLPAVLTVPVVMGLMPRLGISQHPNGRIRLVMGVATGVMAVLILAHHSARYPWWECAGLLIVWALVVWADWTERIIPNRLVLSTILLGVLGHFDAAAPRWIIAGETGAGVLLFFIAINLVSRGGLGMGDAKFSGALGFVLSWPQGMFAISIGIWVAALYGLGLVLIWRSRERRTIAFGPFLVLGGMVGLAGLLH